jgi:hypothetical protein
LIIGNDLLVNEVVLASMFKLVYDGGLDITRSENGNFGWGVLLNKGCGGLV